MRSIVALLSLSAVLVGACAEARIRKVPKRSDYTIWTDDDQRHVDSMDGLRFYRSRPYVVVHKPFPLQSRVTLVDGIVAPDGKSVFLTPDCCPKELVGKLRHWGAADKTGAVPCTKIVQTTKPTPGADVEGAHPQPGPHTVIHRSRAGVEEVTPVTAPGVVSPGALDRIAPHATAEDRPTGTATLRLSSDLNAKAEHKFRDYFDIAYLPDFEEEYVINPIERLGDVNVHLTQGPGGVLLAMGMQVDNSAITRPLVDAYSELVKQGAAVAKGALGKAGGVAMPEDAPPTTAEMKEVAGTRVTLRLHVVKMAAPGLYPILKESEVLETRNCIRTIGPCTCGVCAAKSDMADQIMVPIPPYTRVAYQYFTTVVVEHLLDEPAPVLGIPAAAVGTPRSSADVEAGEEENVSDAQLLQLIDAQMKESLSNLDCPPDISVYALDSRDPPLGGLSSVKSFVLHIRRRDQTAIGPGEWESTRIITEKIVMRSRTKLGLTSLERLTVAP